MSFPITVTEQRVALARREFSSVELTTHYLQRIAQFDAEINSFITVLNNGEALHAAAAADAARAKGVESPLLGIPYANKDIFCTQGVRTSCASKMLDSFIAPYDATVVQRLHAAGMVMLGKTNMDEFAMGSSNETSFYGPTRNPWDLTRVPGGSSGGSAAAVAARFASIATGTDTGGSIRLPAAWCGISGIKPTYGRVSRYGMIAFASSLDQGGPMAHTAEDLALLLDVMCGFDERDSTSMERGPEDFCAQLPGSIKGLRFGIPREFFGAALADEVKTALDAAINVLTTLGAEVREISLPASAYAVPAYYIVASAECSSNLSRYDGVRYGHRCDNPQDLMDLYMRSRTEGFGAEVKRRILVGTYALSTGYYDAYYTKAQQLRRLIKNDFQRAFEEVDLILGPTAPNVAFELGQNAADPVEMYLSDVYTTPANLAGLPAMSIPVGLAHGLPVGMQLIGDYFAEARMLNAAHQYQQVTDWHLRAPAFAEIARR